MHSKTKAIVLSKLKYKDNDLIVKCYTYQDGLVSYLIRSALKASKSSNKIAYFHPLSQLELVQNYKANQSLRYLKEIKPLIIYKTLHTTIEKSAIVMFLSEILSSALREEEANKELYNYIETALQWLDVENKFANFHLLFLLRLTQYLGFYPDLDFKDKTSFNLETGIFENNDNSIYSVSGDNLVLLKKLLGINFDELYSIDLKSSQRQAFLTMLLLYFELHLGNFKKPRSLEILNQVFK